jgi:hypothetical protein
MTESDLTVTVNYAKRDIEEAAVFCWSSLGRKWKVLALVLLLIGALLDDIDKEFSLVRKAEAVGIALVLYTVGLWGLRRRFMRKIRRWLENLNGVRMNFTFSETGIDVSSGSAHRIMPWETIQSIAVSPTLMMVMLKQELGAFIPVSEMSETLRAFTSKKITEHRIRLIGKKATLLLGQSGRA